jgi:addiction module HigA family antidote
MFDVKRIPTHPGEILEEEFRKPLGISQSQLAKEINTTFRTINEIINKKRSISPEMAIKLSRYFGTSEELWLNLQNQYDLYMVKQKKQKFLQHIKSYRELHREAV